MNEKTMSILKKTTKIAGATCFALGGAALLASTAALKAIAEGGKYLKGTVLEILNEKPETDEVVEEVPVEKAKAASAAEDAAEAGDTAIEETQENE